MDTQSTDTPFNKSILEIRFSGPELNSKSVPILDLANTLIATQRMVNKSFLFSQGRLESGRSLTDREREFLSLQIVERRSGSDIFGLGIFTTENFLASFVSGLATNLVTSIFSYAKKRVLSQDEAVVQNQILIINIYSDLKMISERIQSRSGIDAIDFSVTHQPSLPAVSIDKETKEYLKELLETTAYGPERSLTGRVSAMNFEQAYVELESEYRSRIKVYVDKEVIKTIRQAESDRPYVEFYGSPLYRLGGEKPVFLEFQAKSGKLVKGLPRK